MWSKVSELGLNVLTKLLRGHWPLRHIFHHVQENTKIYICEYSKVELNFSPHFKAWLLSTRVYDFNCLQIWTSCGILIMEHSDDLEKKLHQESTLIYLWVTQKQKGMTSEISLNRDLLIYESLWQPPCQCFETALVCPCLFISTASIEYDLF